jgi:hypothetical protein
MASPEFGIPMRMASPEFRAVNAYGVRRIQDCYRGILTKGNEYGVPRVRVPYHWKVIQA